ACSGLTRRLATSSSPRGRQACSAASTRHVSARAGPSYRADYVGVVSTVRAFEPADAESVAQLLAILMPASLHTAESLRWRQSSEPPRVRRRSWVAAEKGEIVGFATANVKWWSGEVGNGRIWVGVREDRRRQGTGSALWDGAVTHLSGVTKHTVE